MHSHAADKAADAKVNEHSFKCITDMTHVRHFEEIVKTLRTRVNSESG